MNFALSTNWCNERIESGEEIADRALELGFDALELGFRTTEEQVRGIRRRLDEMPVGSIHAFCPVPISAPQGHPELYSLASFDEGGRALARLHVGRNVEFAADIGASAVVLHAGRVLCRGLLHRWDMKRRVRRGRKMLDILRRELDGIIPLLEAKKVVLGLENLPYLEGFPAEWEMSSLVGEWVKPWFDTGHDFVRRQRGWVDGSLPDAQSGVAGLHLNDSLGGDDHLPPGEGKVDFSSLKEVAQAAEHLVFEPNSSVTDAALRKGLSHLRTIWC